MRRAPLSLALRSLFKRLRATSYWRLHKAACSETNS